MSTLADLRAQLEANTLALNACRLTLADLRRDRDYPHNNRKYLADAEKRIFELNTQLAMAQTQRRKLVDRTDAIQLGLRLEEEQERHEELQAQRDSLISAIASATAEDATAKAVKPHLKELESLTAKLLSLPQAEMAAILAQLTAANVEVPANETVADDTGAATVVAPATTSGLSADEPGTIAEGEYNRPCD